MISVARAVRRNPPRSSAARGVTATVSSHRPAANGKRTRRERVDANDGLSAGNPTERGGADRKRAQAWRDGDDERRQQHGHRRSDRQPPEAFHVKTKKRRADHESGQGHKTGEPQPSVTHPDPRLPRPRLAAASA